MSSIEKRLLKQEEIEGLTEDLKLVKKWYEIATSIDGNESIFISLVRTKWVRYDELSYQHNLFYYTTDKLKKLMYSSLHPRELKKL